jgi:hypothetical protein
MKRYRGNMGSGKSVPRSGIYGFFHAHFSAHEITLLKGRMFPFGLEAQRRRKCLTPRVSLKRAEAAIHAALSDSASVRKRLASDSLGSFKNLNSGVIDHLLSSESLLSSARFRAATRSRHSLSNCSLHGRDISSH